jgi:hypothetical protein
LHNTAYEIHSSPLKSVLSSRRTERSISVASDHASLQV